MKIVINPLDKKSIDVALKQLTEQKNLFKKMKKEFFNECCELFIVKANGYISMLDIGETIKSELMNGWSYVATDLGARITNAFEKAAYVEFGSGVVGERDPHPMAAKNNYQYNTSTPSKNFDGSWVFESSDSQLDTPRDKVTVVGGQFNELGGGIQYKTFGTQGAMYAYNALMDVSMQTQRIWHSIKAKYWG